MGKVAVRNLTKTFGEGDVTINAVNDLSIEAEDGEFLVLVGPSGCGKSTTLRCIAGLETVTHGDIFIDGKNVTNQKPKNRNIAMVFQNYALYPHMTAHENMAFGLKMTTDLTKEEINRRVIETSKMMGIESLLEKRPGELSGGQQQRVALGRAIVREPEVFLMDEPLSNLDAKLRTTMRTELQELQRRLDITTIYVTHDQTEAMTMGNRIAILNQGMLQQIGTPLKCYNEPANRFVGSFIGSPSMNFLDCQLNGTMLEHQEFDYKLSSETVNQTRAVNGDTLTLGIRPEDIQPAKPSDDNAISAPVKVVEPLGESTFIYFDLGDTECTAKISGALPIDGGENISVSFPEDRIYLFDSKSGEALKTRDDSIDENAKWSYSNIR